MIAYQSSEPIVLNDLIGLNALVNESAKNEQLDKIYILNQSGIIIASNEKETIGEKLIEQDNLNLVKNF